MDTEIFPTLEARPNKKVNGVSPDHAARHPDYEEDNETNWNCHDGTNYSCKHHKKGECTQ